MISFLKVPGGAETAFGQSEAQGPLCGTVVLNCALVVLVPPLAVIRQTVKKGRCCQLWVEFLYDRSIFRSLQHLHLKHLCEIARHKFRLFLMAYQSEKQRMWSDDFEVTQPGFQFAFAHDSLAPEIVGSMKLVQY
jgi:hypothetical protein